MPPRLAAAALPLVLALSIGGCSSEDGASSADPKPLKPADGPDLTGVDFTDATDAAEVTVQVRDNSFTAPYLVVKVGTTVTFDNVGRTQHDVFPVAEGAFTPIETKALQPHDSATLTFDEVGDVPYYCTLHGTTTKGMIGAIRVVD